MLARSIQNAAGLFFGYLTFKPLVFGYSNARVRAMRTALLSRRQAEDLLKIRSVAGIEEYLMKTPYREDFSHMPRGLSEAKRVELAASRNFARTAQKLIRITPKQSLPSLMAFLGRYDIHNLKAILLSKKLGKPPSEIEHLIIQAGSLSFEDLSRLISSKSAASFYEAMRSTKFGLELLNSVSLRHIPKERIRMAISKPGFEELPVDLLLAAMDAYYYELAAKFAHMGDKESLEIARLLSAEADAKNILSILRLKKSGAGKKEIQMSIVKGSGQFSRVQLEKLIEAKDAAEAARLASDFFASSAGKEAFEAAEGLFAKDGRLSHLEIAFENSIARKSLKLLRRSMLSLGTIIGFLLLKEEEMNNIRKIVRGKQLSLPPEKIEEMLVFA
jgi:V/A-type H+-transporting ATPase subunit C